MRDASKAYQIVPELKGILAEDQADALHFAVGLALSGQNAKVKAPNGDVLWEVEVHPKADESDRFHPAMVHYRAAN